MIRVEVETVPSSIRDERRATPRRGVAALAGLAAATSFACADEGAPVSPAPTAQQASPTSQATPPPKGAVPRAAPGGDTRSPEQLVAAGRSVYNANCIACHAMDPKIDGALGPAVAGSSQALLEARVVHGNYPEGYTPKRPSRVMVALPHLKDKLPELTAYLNSL